MVSEKAVPEDPQMLAEMAIDISAVKHSGVPAIQVMNVYPIQPRNYLSPPVINRFHFGLLSA
jgi:hypothetical protein